MSRKYKDFKGCSRTYASLRVYHASAEPEVVTEILQINPDCIQKKGEKALLGKKRPKSGWILSTKDKRNVSRSKDLRAHIEWLLNKIGSKHTEIQKLSKLGYEMWIFCFWGSKFGNGGPILDHGLLKKISNFPFELYLDVWFDPDKD